MDKEINSNTSSKLFTTFHSNKTYDNFNIPDSIDDFSKSSINQSNSISKKIGTIFKENSKKLSKVFEKLHIKDDPQNDYNNKVEIQNDPNLHSEEQDELEIPDDIDKL
ncbi:unnamed protein product [Rhizophagus irregularis]|uniref:Uncharacterized protein n=1 Tax=Rhizophagus irregularis TaxID=588596 RepID=A0A916E284_9GLOM|nr:unnamed protein product [Rhizophagus irregularis]